MSPTNVSALVAMFALSVGTFPNGPTARPHTLVVADGPREVVEGIPVKEREEAPDPPAADQAEHDADAAQIPPVEQPEVHGPDDVEQPED